MIYENTGMNLFVSNSSNTGEVCGSSDVGGLIGEITFKSNTASNSLVVTNFANKGNVSAGFLLVDSSVLTHMAITI